MPGNASRRKMLLEKTISDRNKINSHKSFPLSGKLLCESV